ncbi:MAG: ribonuclease P protein component [Mollicutes bacterium]|jgi:ribonuclease P protein component|nr:ribonuclease P protein component [Mollicutes bacterium]
MKRYEKIKKNYEFDFILNQGKSLNNKYFNIFFVESKSFKPKFGIAVGKKVGNAVVRNKLKRIVTSMIDQNKYLFKNNRNYIIIVKDKCLKIKYEILEKEFINLLKEEKNE